MILRNADILADGFLEAAKKLLLVKVPMKQSFQLAKSVKIISTEYDAAVETRTNLIKQYGKEDGEGGMDVRLSSKEDQAAFFKELQELYSLEFEIPLELKVDLTVATFPENVEMSTVEVFALQCLAKIEEDVVEEKADETTDEKVNEASKVEQPVVEKKNKKK